MKILSALFLVAGIGDPGRVLRSGINDAGYRATSRDLKVDRAFHRAMVNLLGSADIILASSAERSIHRAMPVRPSQHLEARALPPIRIFQSDGPVICLRRRL